MKFSTLRTPMFGFFLLTLAVSKCDHSNFKMCSSYTSQKQYSYAMFVQTWPGSFCSDKCCIIPTESSGLEEGFTIHGFWPQYSGNSYPSCCANDFTDKQVESMLLADPVLTNDVATYWGSMKKCRFAMYEWSKHGTCASWAYTGSTGPIDYLRAGVDMRKNLNIWTKFKEEGVVADGKTKFDKEWLLDIAEKHYGARGFFTCSSNSVSEFRMCTKLDSSNKMKPEYFDCPADLVSSSQCGASISFKTFPKVTTKGPCTY
ncbi:ribonuclease DdI precursor, putative [Entamoeba invadens IP1]|uniref:Ribonuclease DdI, putative n=1 Tax=Entamoeba invadens IP1 TaxID=370355 RepID=A0A0A1TXM1_ENTIV|nr:ribonuclease DdI precursor, putative [Entamoeba invadens IP1]ELP86104.1 ribonuclease DdI precursor, putative [Entamoeba invadens IP1]|eukprot:XP_004185450.1 ribonuclease DdI precursor, putative [Entamoeba invadens IP1]